MTRNYMELIQIQITYKKHKLLKNFQIDLKLSRNLNRLYSLHQAKIN